MTCWEGEGGRGRFVWVFDFGRRGVDEDGSVVGLCCVVGLEGRGGGKG